MVRNIEGRALHQGITRQTWKIMGGCWKRRKSKVKKKGLTETDETSQDEIQRTKAEKCSSEYPVPDQGGENPLSAEYIFLENKSSESITVLEAAEEEINWTHPMLRHVDALHWKGETPNTKNWERESQCGEPEGERVSKRLPSALRCSMTASKVEDLHLKNIGRIYRRY
jgi:hypothetical protein